MYKILQLATQFREAIDKAKENDELYKISPFNRFPKGCCDRTCNLLGNYLLQYGIETFQVNGRGWNYRLEYSENHVWLMTKEGIIIDITGDQFNDEPAFLNYDIPVHVGVEEDLHRLFSENRCIEANMNLVGEPNPYRDNLNKVYEIIKKYL